MGIISLRQAGNDASFIVELYQPSTYIGGTLLDEDNISIAISLVPGAGMSKPLHVQANYPPDSQGGYDIYQSQLSCTVENATALLATGFAFEDEAASIVQQYQIPATTIDRLREEITRLHSEYHQKLMEWMCGQGKREAGPPVPPWQK